MKVGMSSTNITPKIGLPMGGNIRSDNKSRGIHDLLYADIIVMNDRKKEVCFVDLDLLMLEFEGSNYLKRQIEQSSGIPESNITITCTHTHSGPDTSGVFGEMTKECVEYITGQLAIAVMDGVKTAKASLHDVAMGIGKGNIEGISFNRRIFMKDGSLHMNWENLVISNIDKAAGPIDPEFTVIAFRGENGRIDGVMINFTLHPAVLVSKDWLYSKDYIEGLNTAIKEKIGQNIVVFFANGTEGNINHINIFDPDQDRGFEEADRIGRKLAGSVLDVIAGIKYSDECNIKNITKTIKLPLRYISPAQVKWAEKLLAKCGGVIPSLLDGIPDEEYAREILQLNRDNYKRKYISTEIQCIRLRNDTVIITMPAEVFVEFGLELKRRLPYKNTIIFGLANDCIGYIPKLESFSQGGYEPHIGTGSKLAPEAGSALLNEIFSLIKQL